MTKKTRGVNTRQNNLPLFADFLKHISNITGCIIVVFVKELSYESMTKIVIVCNSHNIYLKCVEHAKIIMEFVSVSAFHKIPMLKMACLKYNVPPEIGNMLEYGGSEACWNHGTLPRYQSQM